MIEHKRNIYTFCDLLGDLGGVMDVSGKVLGCVEAAEEARGLFSKETPIFVSHGHSENSEGAGKYSSNRSGSRGGASKPSYSSNQAAAGGKRSVEAGSDGDKSEPENKASKFPLRRAKSIIGTCGY